MTEYRGPGRFKNKFTTPEDNQLLEIVRRFGATDWSSIATQFPGRDARQCRERYMNYLNPTIVTVPWTAEENTLLEEKFHEYGTQWQVIAIFFPTRSRNQVKNHWHSLHKEISSISRPPPRAPSPKAAVSEEVCEIALSSQALWNLFGEPEHDAIRWDDGHPGFF